MLRQWKDETNGSYISVIYGRRRVGKTRLVEETFKDAELFKFEGLEGQSTREQQRQFLARLSEISGKYEYKLIKTTKWADILILLSEYITDHFNDKPVVVFFDEFQWIAAGNTKLVSSLKYVWDNYFTKKNRVHLILCGSVCSFIVKKVLKSKALYGRVNLEINLKPLFLPEIKQVFRPRRSLRDVVELYMVLGGIPKYLELVAPAASVRSNIEKLCFTPNGYLVNEFERIFASHFGTNQHYRRILMTLGKNNYASRDQLQKSSGISSGGRISEYLEDLVTAGFIDRYAPVDKPNAVRINRYKIIDPYLLFYFRFIQPNIKKIQQGAIEPHFTQFVSDKEYDIWCELAFEFVCMQHSHLIAERLGFSSVRYEVGSWFNRSSDKQSGQIDLLYIRADRVIILCEVKFRNTKIGREIIEEIERKKQALFNPKRYTIETVLISASQVTEDLKDEKYFNRILSLEDIFEKESAVVPENLIRN